MGDFNSPSSTTLAELKRLINEYEEKIKNGTSDPEHFMTISEMEKLWSKLNSDTKDLYSDLTAKLIRELDQKPLVDAKKENSKPKE